MGAIEWSQPSRDHQEKSEEKDKMTEKRQSGRKIFHPLPRRFKIIIFCFIYSILLVRVFQYIDFPHPWEDILLLVSVFVTLIINRAYHVYHYGEGIGSYFGTGDVTNRMDKLLRYDLLKKIILILIPIVVSLMSIFYIYVAPGYFNGINHTDDITNATKSDITNATNSDITNATKSDITNATNNLGNIRLYEIVYETQLWFSLTSVMLFAFMNPVYSFRKEFKYYFTKECFRVSNDENLDQIEKTKFLLLGVRSYNQYIKKNLDLKINKIDILYSRLSSDYNSTYQCIKLVNDAIDDRETMKLTKCLQDILKTEKDKDEDIEKEFLVENKLIDKISTLSTVIVPVVTVLISVITLFI